MPITHIVRDGECLNSIADRYGFFPDTIWDHPDNAELKRARPNPGVLDAGDELVIPDKRAREVDGATDQRHRFRRRGVPSLFHMQIFAEGEARADVPFVLDHDLGREVGRTDGDGWIRASIPPKLRSARLEVGEGDELEVYVVRLGHLDPIDTIEGVQMRLANLGFVCRPTGRLDEATELAIQAFQESIDHPEPWGELDRQTLDELEASHGGT